MPRPLVSPMLVIIRDRQRHRMIRCVQNKLRAAGSSSSSCGGSCMSHNAVLTRKCCNRDDVPRTVSLQPRASEF